MVCSSGQTQGSTRGSSSKTINTATASTRIKTKADILARGSITSSTDSAYTSLAMANATSVAGAMASLLM